MANLQADGVAHPNIVQMLYCCWDTELLLCLAYYHRGSLHDILADSQEQPTWTELTRLVLGVCAGMSYLHSCSPSILHLIKPGNIILDDKDRTAGMIVLRASLTLARVWKWVLPRPLQDFHLCLLRRRYFLAKMRRLH